MAYRLSFSAVDNPDIDPVSFIPEDLDKGFALKGWPYAKRA